jgi:hypothetical protein
VEIARKAFHSGDPEASDELGLYTDRTELTAFRRQLRGIGEVRLVSAGDRRYEYEFSGTRPGTAMRMTIEQNGPLTRISFS